MTAWLDLRQGEAPLIVAIPHAGTDIPSDIEARLVSPWRARKDTDWWVDRLYDFARDLDATIVRTHISRTVIDVNRDPSGASLYPGLATTELCPTMTFDGEPLYKPGGAPSPDDIEARRSQWFDPYHAALAASVDRLKRRHSRIVLYDAHSIRSSVPRLFEGTLPNFNIGTYSGASCGAGLTTAVEDICRPSGFSAVINGRFKGGWTTRHYGRPGDGVHAIQMELACRGYMSEPAAPNELNWPPPFDANDAGPMRGLLVKILEACVHFSSTT